MPTPKVLKALEIYTTYFQKYLDNSPVMWDTKTNRFYYIGCIRKLYFWIWNMAVVITITGCGTTVVILIREILVETKTIPIFNILTLILLLVMGTSDIGMSIGLLAYGKEFVYGWNELHKLEKRMSEREKKISKPQNRDYLGASMIIMVRLFTFYAIFVALFGLAMRLDPFYIVINWTLSNIQGDINRAQVINDYSVMVLHKWNVEIMMEPDIKERNILRKKLKSLKPKKLHVGIHERFRRKAFGVSLVHFNIIPN
ncbi:uncharacterized protein LOC118439403 [Folsomia candida]|uniref:uncharacterized protein LOC118439403 n=1 Tax=Folsomia candida TaxID=158441 RepID=UPI0016052320|nr:uncharacterized protein LOC118439403 [Folsomia candida]